jgi:hypothetical protein
MKNLVYQHCTPIIAYLMSTAAVLPLSTNGISTGQIGKVWSHKSHETGHNEQYFTCQTKLQQTMLWACVRYSSCHVF